MTDMPLIPGALRTALDILDKQTPGAFNAQFRDDVAGVIVHAANPMRDVFGIRCRTQWQAHVLEQVAQRTRIAFDAVAMW